MKRFLGVGVFVLISQGLAGCIVKDTSHDLYLSPDGSVVWSVLERHVRSDESDAWKRGREERSFLDGVSANRHPIALGLNQLAADGTSVRLLRAERPYTVLTEARFARIDHVIRAFFDELRAPGEASLARNGDETTLSVTLDLTGIERDAHDEDTPVASLIEDLNCYRLILTEGRFVRAEGFEILENGSQARLKIADAENQRFVLRLAWTGR